MPQFVEVVAAAVGTSVAMIDRTYGHLVRGSEEATIARMNARSQRLGQERVTSEVGAGTR